MSSGASVRGSITSTEMPRSASRSAAVSASSTMPDSATTVTSVALARHACAAERDRLARLDLASPPVEPDVLDEEDGVAVEQRTPHEAVRVRRVRRHGDLDPGDVHEPRLEALRVLGPHAHPGHDRSPDHERHGELPAGEVVQLRGLVEDLVHRDADEVEELDLAHRPHARDGETDRVADRARLAERRVADPLLAVVVEEAAGDAERAAVGADVLTDQHHRLGPLERLAEGLVDRLAHRHRRRRDRLGGRRHGPPSIDSRNLPQGSGSE